jgi:hypothetical protein
MNLTIERYIDQAARWPTEGRHILAQFLLPRSVPHQALGVWRSLRMLTLYSPRSAFHHVFDGLAMIFLPC